MATAASSGERRAAERSMRTGSLPTMGAWPLPSVPPRPSPEAATPRLWRCVSPCSAGGCSRPRRTSSRASATPRRAPRRSRARRACRRRRSTSTSPTRRSASSPCSTRRRPRSCARWSAPSDAEGHASLRGARRRRRARLPGDARLAIPTPAQTLLVADHRRRAARRRSAATRSSRPSPTRSTATTARRAEVRRADVRVAATTRSRSSARSSSSSRAACAPAARRRARARAGHRAG